MPKPSTQSEAAALAKSQGWRVVRKRNNRVVFISPDGRRRTFNNHLYEAQSNGVAGRQMENFLRSLRSIGFSYDEPVKKEVKPPMAQTPVIQPVPQPVEKSAPAPAPVEAAQPPSRTMGSIVNPHQQRYRQCRDRLTKWHHQAAGSRLRSPEVGHLIDGAGVSRSVVYRMLRGKPITEGSLNVINQALDIWEAEHQNAVPAPKTDDTQITPKAVQVSPGVGPDLDIELGAIAAVMRALGALRAHQRARVMQYVQARLSDAPDN